MSTIERFMYFATENWPWVLVACVLVCVVGITRRRSPWIIALWLPSFSIASAYALSVVIVVLHGYASRSRESFIGLWVALQVAAALPLVVAALLLLSVRPPRVAWRSRAAVVGVILAGAIPLVLHAMLLATRIRVEFLVQDARGAPLAGVGFRLSDTSPPLAVSDARGRLTRPMERGRDVAGWFTAPGCQDLAINVSAQGRGPESLFVSQGWFRHEGSSLRSTDSDAASYPASSAVSIPVVMRLDSDP